MVSKIRVYGKAQNRTALGIINAYQVMYPNATLEDMKKAFPDSLNPDCGTKVILMTEADIKKHIAGGEEWYAQGQGYFLEDDEWLIMPDKTRVAVVRMWTKPSFERLVSHAAQYGIEIAKFEEKDKGFGKKGSFRLEYLNGYIPPKPIKKGLPWWVWAIMGALLLLVILLFLLRGCNKPEPQVIIEKEVVTVVDTVWMGQIEEIEKNFNAAQFKQGSAELSEEAKFVLHDLAKLLNTHHEIRLKLEGHTSAEGNPQLNQKLSEARAKAAVDFLVNERGVNASQLEYEGKGSSEPIDPNNPKINRRTEFIVLE